MLGPLQHLNFELVLYILAGNNVNHKNLNDIWLPAKLDSHLQS